MKKTTATIALSFIIATLAATPVLADETVDCFYEANRSDALCQTTEVAQPAPSLIAEPEYIALVSMFDESVDCFYDANRWTAACTTGPKIVVLGSLAE